MRNCHSTVSSFSFNIFCRWIRCTQGGGSRKFEKGCKVILGRGSKKGPVSTFVWKRFKGEVPKDFKKSMLTTIKSK